MGVWFYIGRTERNDELAELFSALEPISLVIRKGRLSWFGHVEHKVDSD